MMTKKRLARVMPLKAGQMFGTGFALLTLTILPLFALNILTPPPEFQGKLGPMLMAPLLNAAAGFILGAVLAALYNVAAAITGGLEIVIDEDPPAPVQ